MNDYPGSEAIIMRTDRQHFAKQKVCEMGNMMTLMKKTQDMIDIKWLLHAHQTHSATTKHLIMVGCLDPSAVRAHHAPKDQHLQNEETPVTIDH
jgi:hypothetical protein